MSIDARRALTVVLPFAPQDQDAHDRLVAAACALHARGGWGRLQVVQCVPRHGMVEPRAAAEALEWWDVECADASERAGADTLAAIARAALATPDLSSATSRLILTPAGPIGEEAAALLAAMLDAPALGRCLEFALVGELVSANRRAYGGRLSIELQTDAVNCCASWRPQGEMEHLTPVNAPRVHWISLTIKAAAPADSEALPASDGQARLEGARVVVSGGRGMAGPAGFELLGRIAARLGAAVGGSLPAADAGWIPVARQVGQSGRFVSPQLYFAVGISGTPQHLAGIANTTRIVAVNKDPDAPIFSVADVGVVADWTELLPLLEDVLEAATSAAATEA